MKKTEIAMIILIASLSMLATFFLVRTIFGDSIKKDKTVPVITEVRDELIPPSKLIFNKNAINPTVEVFVDENVSSGATASADAQNAPEQQTNTGQSQADE